MKLRDSQQTIRRAWISREHNELAIRRALGRPFEVISLRGLAVLVNTKERNVEVVARISKVVVVAAEKACLLLDRENQPDVGVLLVPVEPVFASAVKRHHLASQLRCFGRLFPDSCDLRFTLL